jgi:hypothetical protein
MRRALVLSAETPSAVAVVRSLHAAGFEVAALAESLVSPAAASWRCALPLRVGVWSAEDLVTHVLDTDADLVVPVTEGDLLRLAPVRTSVERLCPVLAPPARALDALLDKHRVGVAARAVGARREGDELTGADEIVLPAGEKVGESSEGDFPLVAKPRRSRSMLPDGSVWGMSARFCADAYDLREAHREFAAGGQDTLAQRPVYGAPLLVSVFLDHDDVLRGAFVHRRLRQAQPEGGPSACAISHAAHRRIVDPVVELARELDARGAPVQFELVVPDAGPPVLLDVNPRPWGTLGLALAAGADLYGRAARAALGEALDDAIDPLAYEVGVARHYLPFEVRHALAVLLRGPQKGFEGSWPSSRLAAALQWGALPGAGLVFQPGDPLPALADALHLVRRAVLGG